MSLKFRIQSTPNPRARKYVINDELKATGRVSYSSKEECHHVPMAEALLCVPGVSQVHFFENVVTVTQSGSINWQEIDKSVQAVISENINNHDIYFSDMDPQLKKPTKKNLSPELAKIDAIIERTIRPGLQSDGGDVEVVAYEEHILTVKYLGACGSCPSAMTGTLNAIRDILRDEYDPSLDVAVL